MNRISTLPNRSYTIQYIHVHWRLALIYILPIILLPIFMIKDTKSHRFIYIAVLLCTLSLAHCMPLAMICLLPMILFPLMSLLDTGECAFLYMQESGMQYIASSFIAIAVSNTMLSRRIGLNLLLLCKCNPYKAHLVVITLTVLIAWCSLGMLATATVMPIAKAILKCLEKIGIGSYFKVCDEPIEDTDAQANSSSKLDIANPTSAISIADTTPSEKLTGSSSKLEAWSSTSNWKFETLTSTSDYTLRNLAHLNINKLSPISHCFYLSIAYYSNMASVTFLDPSYTERFNEIFPEAPPITFLQWLSASAPISATWFLLVGLYMQVFYLGLFRPKCKNAKAILMPEDVEALMSRVRRMKWELGKMQFSEYIICVTYGITVILIWCLGYSGHSFVWLQHVSDMQIGPSTLLVTLVLIYFMIPKNPTFIYGLQKGRRHRKPSAALIDWNVLQKQGHWGIIFVIGASYVFARTFNKYKVVYLYDRMVTSMGLYDYHYLLLALATVSNCILAELSAKRVLARDMFLHLSVKAVNKHVNPLEFLILHCWTASNTTMCMMGSPSNAFIGHICKMNTLQFLTAGAPVSGICCVVMFLYAYPLLQSVYGVNEYPDWADKMNTSITQ